MFFKTKDRSSSSINLSKTATFLQQLAKLKNSFSLLLKLIMKKNQRFHYFASTIRQINLFL